MKKLIGFITSTCVVIMLLSFSLYFFDWVDIKYNSSFKTNYLYISDEELQTYEGVGCSSAWTSQIYGKNETLSSEIVTLLYGSEENSLGLNIYRYNLGGGGSDSAIINEFPYSEGWYQAERGAECFLKNDEFSGTTALDVLNYVSNEDNYDFSKDEAAQLALNQALELGNIEQLVLFVNSPSRIMTLNGKCVGTNEYDNNLREDCYEAYAKYLMVITNYFVKLVDSKGLSNKIEIVISPVNEPQWKWGGESASQEGCHYDPDKCALVLNYVWNEMNTYKKTNNVANLSMEAFESGNIKGKSGTFEYIKEMQKYEYYEQLDNIAVHSYGNPLVDKYRTIFTTKVDKAVSVSEYCQMENSGIDLGIDGAVHVAKVMTKDFHDLKTISWCWWIGVSMYDYNWNDGIIYIDWNEDTDEYVENSLEISKRYYTMMHFTKFLKTGDKCMDSKICFSTSSTLDHVVFKNSDGSYSLIIVNSGKKAVNINLPDEFSSMKQYITDETHNCEQVGTEEFTNKISVEGNSIMTIKLYK